MKLQRLYHLLVPASAIALLAPGASATDDVIGPYVTLTDSATTPNGAWCWYQGERAIVDDSDPDNTLLLVTAISAGSAGESGDLDLHWLNLDTGVRGGLELHDAFQQDDHAAAALWLRPDGRYVACYSRHGSDQYMYWRVSTNPHDPTSWSVEKSVDATGSASSDNATYNNVYYLPNDAGGAGRLYDFSRLVNWSPGLLVSSDHGDSWAYAGALLNAGGPRPYVRYFCDGDRIHFTATDGHPRDVNNSIYHGYVQDGKLYASDGALLDSNLFDGSAIAPSGLTTVFAANTVVNGTPMTRCWTVDTAIDSDGNPYTVFQARIDPGTLSGGQESLDHEFFYARYDGGSSSWVVHPLAPAGRDIYAASPNGSEDDYTGLVALDPDDPSTVYVSTEIDPRDDTPLAHYEIFRGVTSDGGATWTWEPITWDSTMENVRPIVPKWNEGSTVLLWMRGTYDTYTSWGTEAVALVLEQGPAGDAAYCFGDPGVDAPCPCANDNDGSVPGSGCANGVFPSGARLTVNGVASIGADTLVLAATGLEPSNAGLYFQGDNDLSPGLPWGDGLRCAGGGLRRLGVRFSDAGGASDTSGLAQPISVRAGNVQVGDTKYYQCWYRNPIYSPCLTDFNTTNGYAVTWQP